MATVLATCEEITKRCKEYCDEMYQDSDNENKPKIMDQELQKVYRMTKNLLPK